MTAAAEMLHLTRSFRGCDVGGLHVPAGSAAEPGHDRGRDLDIFDA